METIVLFPVVAFERQSLLRAPAVADRRQTRGRGRACARRRRCARSSRAGSPHGDAHARGSVPERLLHRRAGRFIERRGDLRRHRRRRGVLHVDVAADSPASGPPEPQQSAVSARPGRPARGSAPDSGPGRGRAPPPEPGASRRSAPAPRARPCAAAGAAHRRRRATTRRDRAAPARREPARPAPRHRAPRSARRRSSRSLLRICSERTSAWPGHRAGSSASASRRGGRPRPRRAPAGRTCPAAPPACADSA